MLYIHPGECVDCGASEPVCPVETIYDEDDLPDHWSAYFAANIEFFDDIGSPGGAAKTGVIDEGSLARRCSAAADTRHHRRIPCVKHNRQNDQQETYARERGIGGQAPDSFRSHTYCFIESRTGGVVDAQTHDTTSPGMHRAILWLRRRTRGS